MPNHIKPMEGLTFGRLRVLSASEKRIRGSVGWLCVCDCGKRVTVSGASMRRGEVRSCGCLASETIRSRQTKHGQCGKITYESWRSMHRRCSDPRHDSYSLYGGRGITVCDRWSGFQSFLEDMGKRPSANYTLDRIDSDGHYQPENCRWADASQQNRNRRNALYVRFRNKEMHLIDACKKKGVSFNTIQSRMQRKGVSAQEAFDLPIKPRPKA